MTTKNHLRGEGSPYLIQHLYNPVDWYPWGDAAFKKAREEDKPIFLSIGYSTCHWCHVMERESFENREVAQLMNDAFVSVKVDREERPDIDKVYMNVCQMMTGRGGWPLTIIMTPDKKPFFAATYIPTQSGGGGIGLVDLIPRVMEVWEHHRDDVDSSASEVAALLKREDGLTDQEKLDELIIDEAIIHLTKNFDMRYGGFGRAPKFPTPHAILFLLRHWRETGKGEPLHMAAHTLRNMRMGGIYDHVGYGFHRYSTDEQWRLPHFEKMLYDQAMLIIAYIEAYQVTRDTLFLATARETADYVLRDLSSPEGGFYSAEDADSEGREGKFYLWTEEEIDELLGPADATLAKALYNLQRGGNFLEEATNARTGENVLYLSAEPGEELSEKAERIREKLYEGRCIRERPMMDTKILTDWNGIMIAALALLGRVSGEKEYLAAAEKSARFILKTMKHSGGKLYHRYINGGPDIPGNLDDYAFAIWGFIDLYQATFRMRYLETVLEIADSMDSLFSDPASGIFFFTSSEGEKLLSRTIETYDGALPSGNSAAFYNLIRLGRITGHARWEERARKLLQAASGSIKTYPAGHTIFLSGLRLLCGEPVEIVLAGNLEDKAVADMRRLIDKRFLPEAVIVHVDRKNRSALGKMAPRVIERGMIQGKGAAYVCRGRSCLPPATSVSELKKILA